MLRLCGTKLLVLVELFIINGYKYKKGGDIVKRMILFLIITVILTSCANTSNDNYEDKSVKSKIEETNETTITFDENEESILEEERAELLDNVFSGGPSPDGIPPIEKPKFESIENADKWLNDYDRVFLYETKTNIYLFPQRVLVWHEIVNVKDVDDEYAMTYCPLTGSAIAYMYPLGNDTSYGTSGNLINSNLLMYDRKSGAYISQIDGVGLDSELLGVELKSRPVYWIRWDKAKKSYDQAKVLSKNTGFIRDYNRDPYGKYVDDQASGYYSEQGTIFPVMHEDDENIFADKTTIIGIKQENERIALNPLKVKQDGKIVLRVKDKKIVALYDEKLDIVRLYYEADNQSLQYKNGIIESENGLSWTVLGEPIEGNESLELPIYFEVMWFAWYAFYPATEVIE